MNSLTRMFDDTLVLFLIGPSNCGKSTQIRALAENGFAYAIEPREWLRQMRLRTGSELGDYIENNWRHESLEPLVTEHVMASVGENLYSRKGVVVDDYPNTRAEAEALARICRGKYVCVIEIHGFRTASSDEEEDTPTRLRRENYERHMKDVRSHLQFNNIYHSVNGDGSVAEVTERILNVVKGVRRRLVIPPHISQTVPGALLKRATHTETAVAIQKTLRLAHSTRLYRQFCGTHPVSLDRENLDRLHQFPYLVSLKADGCRFLCVVAFGRLWFVSRALDVWRSEHDERLIPFENTLLDGEIVGVNTFLVFDCIAFAGANCATEPILSRLQRCVPLGQLMYNAPLQFRMQTYTERSKIRELLGYAKTLPWALDGLIFQPARLPYRLGIDYNMFKWKPPGQNTSDFYYWNLGLYARWSKRTGRSLPPEGEPQKLPDGLSLTRMSTLLEENAPNWLHNGMIIECSAVITGCGEIVWRVEKHRNDKEHPNIDWVAERVIRSIHDNLCESELIEFCTAQFQSEKRIA